jgi:hypothetical protein
VASRDTSSLVLCPCAGRDSKSNPDSRLSVQNPAAVRHGHSHEQHPSFDLPHLPKSRIHGERPDAPAIGSRRSRTVIHAIIPPPEPIAAFVLKNGIF